MINSRKIEDLEPDVADKCRAFVNACALQGVDILITSTYRDRASQAALYAQGRTAPGARVTNAGPGDSFHNWRVAFDWVPLVHGKPAWDDVATFRRCGVIAESLGLEWAGRWHSFPEMAHCQDTGGRSIAVFKAQASLSAFA